MPEKKGGDILQGHLVHLIQASLDLPRGQGPYLEVKQPHPSSIQLKPPLYLVSSESAFLWFSEINGQYNLHEWEKTLPSYS